MATFNRKRTLLLAQMAILLAIEAVVCFTPLGSLPTLGPVVATLSHVPVILTAILLGPAAGSLMGFAFGLFSFLVWTFTPPLPIAFVFTPFYSLGELHGNAWSLVICFVPRILIGLVAGLVFRLFEKKNAYFAAGLAGALGTLTNTLLVFGGIWLFFGAEFAAAQKIAYSALLAAIGTTILVQGLPEAAIGGLVGSAVAVPVRRALGKQLNGD